MKIVTIAEMRELERQAEAKGVSNALLMERAGRAVAQEVRDALGGAAARKVVVLVGPGNNGGDGLVAARFLSDWGAQVQLYLLSSRGQDDQEYQAARQRRIAEVGPTDANFIASLRASISSADAVVDAVLGTGHSRPLTGLFQQALEAVSLNSEGRRKPLVVAVDLPSGLDADTGALDPATPGAHMTVTFANPKHGHFRFPGAAAVGELKVVDIGIPPGQDAHVLAEALTAAQIAKFLPVRPLQANKGTFGRLLVVAGSRNYRGAAVLACRAALRVGAGLVTLAAPQSVVQSVAGMVPEVTYLPLPETLGGVLAPNALDELEDEFPRYDATLIGCGLGQAPETRRLVESLLLGEIVISPKVVVDADALNILAGIPAWWERFPQEAVLTPHPGEMARLLGKSVSHVQDDRLAAARSAAATWNKVVVLKGAFTVVATATIQAGVSPYANPALATAGTGDVLAGMVAGLLAQDCSLYVGASVGVFLHGLAGKRFAETRGNAGLIASDLLDLLPSCIAAVRAGEIDQW